MTEGVLRAYVWDHRLPKAGLWVPDPHEREPAPCGDERVILTSYLDRGLGLPIHPFL